MMPVTPRKTKRIFLFRIFLSHTFVPLLLVLAATLSAASAESLKIGVVDTQRVLNESVLGKASKSSLEAHVKKGQAKLATMKSDLEKEQEGLQKQSGVLSASALDARKEALGKKQVEFQRAYEDLQASLRRQNESEIAKVVVEIDATVKAVAADNGYTFVFERDKDSVVYASDRVDITQQVIQALDKRKVGL